VTNKGENLKVVISVAILVGLVAGLGTYFTQSSKISNLKKQVLMLKKQKSQDIKTSKEISKKESSKNFDRKNKKTTEKESIAEKTKEFGFIKKVYSNNGKNYLTIDYAQWLNGAAADKAAIADGKIPKGEHVDNGYYIRNNNPKLRTFEVDSNTNITMKTYKTKGNNPKNITFSQFKAIYLKNNTEVATYTPFWVELKGSTITSIEEQFIP